MDSLSIEGGHCAEGTLDAVFPALDWTKVVRVLVDEGENLQVMQVHGDSLSDAFVNDGDLVLLKPKPTAQNGDMVAAWIKSTQAMTLVYYHRENGHVRPQPANPALPALQLRRHSQPNLHSLRRRSIYVSV
jgi:SOS-response transcriptional repressor LexA